MWVLSPFYIIGSKDLVTQLTRDHSLFKQLSKLICRGATKQISSMCGLTILLHMSKKFLRYVFFLLLQNHTHHNKYQKEEENTNQRMHLKVQPRTGESWRHLHDQLNCNSSSNLYNLDIFFLLFLFIQPKKKKLIFIFNFSTQIHDLTWLPK